MMYNKAVSKVSYAFKVDMSKAYGKVEWAFLERVMLQIRIGSHLVNTIMRCVTSVSFAVLVNRVPTSTFYPSRPSPGGSSIPLLVLVLCRGIVCNDKENGGGGSIAWGEDL